MKVLRNKYNFKHEYGNRKNIILGENTKKVDTLIGIVDGSDIKVLCPKCGRINTHGIGSDYDIEGAPFSKEGEKNFLLHRGSHCGCHENGYYILPMTEENKKRFIKQ